MLNEVAAGQLVEVVRASKIYGELAALDNLSLRLDPGTFTVLLGPSGSGKSTLIRSVAGIEKLDGGQISFGGKIVANETIHTAPEKRDLAMVFQDYALWPHMTAVENVAYALKRLNLESKESRNRTLEALERVGLSGRCKNYPHELSGGEQQRVALARAVVARPSLLLFDEPLSNLDADLRERLRVEISTVTREMGATALYITHDQSEAFALADVVGVIRSGKLEQLAKPEIVYRNPATRFVAAFTGLAGSFIGCVVEQGPEFVIVDVRGVLLKTRANSLFEDGALVEILIRPTASTFTANGENQVSAIIVDSAYRGRGYDHVVKTAFGTIAGVHAEQLFTRGSRVEISIDAEKSIAFPLAQQVDPLELEN